MKTPFPIKHNVRKSKYNAVATIVDGMRFDSKKEAKHYSINKIKIAAGEMVMQLRQSPFHLTAGVVYKIDFIEFYSDGTVLFVDVKGRDTPMSKMKRRQVEALYPIIITLA